jgi:hypothetical protein
MRRTNMSELVLVTGGSGYIAGWCVAEQAVAGAVQPQRPEHLVLMMRAAMAHVGCWCPKAVAGAER